MKAAPSKRWLGYALTSRATCRVCKRRIDKGSIRLIESAFVCHGHRTQRSVHVACVKVCVLSSLPMCADIRASLDLN